MVERQRRVDNSEEGSILTAGVPIGPDHDLTAEARIRRAALVLFGQRGYEATSTREIAALAGVSKTLVAHHFGTKERLRDQIDRDVMATVDQLFEKVRPKGSALDFSSFGESYHRLFAEHPDITAYIRRGILEPTAESSGLLLRILGLIEEILEQLIASGLAARPTDTAAAVVLQANLAMTAILLGPALGGYLDSDEPIETRLARAEIELAVKGYFYPAGLESITG